MLRPAVRSRVSLTGLATGLLCCFCLVPLLSDDTYLLYIATLAAVYALAAVGLNIVHGFSGQISLGHGSLVAIGAYVTAILSANHGWSIAATIVPAVAVTVVGAAVMSLPSLRLSRWYLAVVTMAFGLVVGGFINSDQELTGGGNGLVGIPSLTVFGHQLDAHEMYVVLVVLVAAAVVFSWNLRRSPKGLTMIAVRDSELVAQSVGVSVSKTKMWAFAISGIPVGLAGALWASLGGYVSPGQFDLSFSVMLFLIVLIGGDGRVVGPILGAMMMQLLPQVLTSFEKYQLIVYAVLLLVVAILAPNGLVGIGISAAQRLRTWSERHPILRHTGDRAGAEEVPAGPGRDDIAAPAGRVEAVFPGAALRIEGLSRSFGGVHALRNVSLTVAAGSTVGLIGPNGSGKTTLLNMISGLYPPSVGKVLFDGVAVGGERATARARRGIGRTFQTPRLLDREKVVTNVVLGAARLRRKTALRWLVRSPGARREEIRYRQQAEDWLRRFGIAHLSDQDAGNLSHGDKRLLEIVRALMSQPKVLLLDEPSSGLGAEEVSRLRVVIASLARTGLTIILVEHHVGLVRAVASEIAILDQGGLIASGPAEEVLNDRAVVGAYLGTVLSGIKAPARDERSEVDT